MYPNFAHVRQLQQIEMGDPLKIAHKLSDKVISPLAMEKTNVMLADALFDESTINSIRSEIMKIELDWIEITNMQT